MNRNIISINVCLGLACLAVTSCVSVQKVTIKDAPRKSVGFESAAAAQAFYDALLARHFPADGKPSRIRAGQTLYTQETRTSANVAFNEGVAEADTDGNGVISQQEASAYASIPTR